MLVSMSDVTRILQRIETGDAAAAKDLLPLVYDELRKLAAAKMAAERPDHTLQATALVHEAYLRLVDQDQAQQWDSRGHFFSAAAQAMRRILIDSARAKQSRKRGADSARDGDRDLEQMAEATMITPPDELLDIDAALDRLQVEDPQVAELVQLRLYAGLSNREAAKVLGIPHSTAHDHWRFARSWFTVELNR